MGCSEKKLSKNLTQTFMAYCNVMICQQATLSGEAERPKVADAVIEAAMFIFLPSTTAMILMARYSGIPRAIATIPVILIVK